MYLGVYTATTTLPNIDLKTAIVLFEEEREFYLTEQDSKLTCVSPDITVNSFAVEGIEEVLSSFRPPTVGPPWTTTSAGM